MVLRITSTANGQHATALQNRRSAIRHAMNELVAHFSGSTVVAETVILLLDKICKTSQEAQIVNLKSIFSGQ